MRWRSFVCLKIIIVGLKILVSIKTIVFWNYLSKQFIITYRSNKILGCWRYDTAFKKMWVWTLRYHIEQPSKSSRFGSLRKHFCHNDFQFVVFKEFETLSSVSNNNILARVSMAVKLERVDFVITFLLKHIL